jgi:hypothetical protein
VHGVVATTRGLSRARRPAGEVLEELAPVIADNYQRHKVYGHVEHIRFLPATEDRSRRVRVSIIRRTLYTPPPLERVQPARQHELYLGETHGGPVWWHLADDAHALIAAPTRLGKGVLVRMMATQALLAGWVVVVLDGTGSPEWNVMSPHPNFVWQQAVDPRAWYQWAVGTVVEAGDGLRDRLVQIGAAGFDNWMHATEAGRTDVAGPRMLLIMDETTATLGMSKDSPNAKAAKQLAEHIDTATRAWAKAGGHVVVMDQSPYQGITGLAQPTRNQLGRYVGLGSLTGVQQEMIGGLRDWPFVSGEPGHGCTGRKGSPPSELRVPGCPREVIEASIAAAVTGSRSA